MPWSQSGPNTECTEIRNTGKTGSTGFHYSSVIYVCELSTLDLSCFSFWNSCSPLFASVRIQEEGTSSWGMLFSLNWMLHLSGHLTSSYTSFLTLRHLLHCESCPNNPSKPSWAQLFTWSSEQALCLDIPFFRLQYLKTLHDLASILTHLYSGSLLQVQVQTALPPSSLQVPGKFFVLS